MELIDIDGLVERLSEGKHKYEVLLGFSNGSSLSEDYLLSSAKRLLGCKPTLNLSTQTATNIKDKFKKNIERLNDSYATSVVDLFEAHLLTKKYVEYLARHIEQEISKNAMPEDAAFVANTMANMAENLAQAEAVSKFLLPEISDIKKMGSDIGINVPEFDKQLQAAELRVQKLEFIDDMEYINGISHHAVGTKLKADVRAAECHLEYSELILAGSFLISKVQNRCGVFNWAQVGGLPPQISKENLGHKMKDASYSLMSAEMSAFGMGYLLDKDKDRATKPKSDMN